MKKIFCAGLLLVTFTLAAHAQRYVSSVSGTITSRDPGALGPIVTNFHKRDLLTIVANTGGRSLDPKTLQLVYDTAAQQFQVVQKADGTLVAVVYSVVDVKEIGVGAADIVNVRQDSIQQADLAEPGTPGVVGTVGGRITKVDTFLDFAGNVPKTNVHWAARFSVLSETGGVFMQPQIVAVVGGPAQQYAAAPSLIQGEFVVHGTGFVPGKTGGE